MMILKRNSRKQGVSMWPWIRLRLGYRVS